MQRIPKVLWTSANLSNYCDSTSAPKGAKNSIAGGRVEGDTAPQQGGLARFGRRGGIQPPRVGNAVTKRCFHFYPHFVQTALTVRLPSVSICTEICFGLRFIHPAGDGGAAILCSMFPNTRRVR